MTRLMRGIRAAGVVSGLGLLGVFGTALPTQAASSATVAAADSADDSGDVADFLAAIGGLGILSGPVFYLVVKRKYSLTDNDDAKDQAIQASLVVIDSSTRSGDQSRAIQSRYPTVKPQSYSKTRDKQTGRYVAKPSTTIYGIDLPFV